MAGMVGLGIALGMFPVVNWLARIGGAEDNGAGVGGLGVLCWLGIGVQLGLYMLSYMSYGSFCLSMSISISLIIVYRLFSMYVYVHLILGSFSLPPRNDERARPTHRIRCACLCSYRGLLFIRAFS